MLVRILWRMGIYKINALLKTTAKKFNKIELAG
jgi:hypothetical protein